MLGGFFRGTSAFINVSASIYFRRLTGDFYDALVCATAIIGFQTLMWNYWYYPWDPIDLICFSILVLSDKDNQRSIAFFCAISLIWVICKETVIFVPLWVFITRLAVPSYPRSARRWVALNWRLALTTLLMFASSLAVVSALRSWLFVQSVLPGVGSDNGHATFGNFLIFSSNIKTIGDAIGQLFSLKLNVYNWGVCVGIGLFVLTTYASVRVFADESLRDDRRLVNIVVFMCAYMVTTLITCSFSELRVYLPFCPMMVAFYLAYRGHRAAEART
jgi:hypothetical protein